MNTHREICFRLLRLLRPLRPILLLSIAARALNQLFGIALLAIAIWGLVRLGINHSSALLLRVALVLVGLGMAKGVFRYLEQFSGHYVAFRILSDLRHHLYEKLERLCPRGLPYAQTGDLVSRAISDIERIEVFFAHTIAPVLIALIVPTTVCLVIAWMNVALALALLPFLLVVGVLTPLLAHLASKNAARESRLQLAAQGTFFTESVQGIREILIFNNESNRRQRLRFLSATLRRADGRLASAGAFQMSLTELTIGLGLIAILWVGAHQIYLNQLPAADLPVIFALSIGAFVPLLALSTLIPDFEQAIQSAARHFEILDKPEPEDTPCFSSTSFTSGIRFDGVTFCHADADRPVIEELSFSAQPGEITALVGESGAGKSTIVQLLLGFARPNGGRIFVGGREVRSFEPEALRECLSVVPQNVHLFNATVRENILLGRPSATQAEVEEAARLAQVHDLIRSLPHGYETKTQEFGSRFSGGQIQRIALARAFLKNASILILDEASAHLDIESEKLILNSLRQWLARPELAGKGTVLLFAHRPTWVRQANQIHVLKDGRITDKHHDTPIHPGTRQTIQTGTRLPE